MVETARVELAAVFLQGSLAKPQNMRPPGAPSRNRTEVFDLEGRHNSRYTNGAGASLENRTLLSALQKRCITTMLARH